MPPREAKSRRIEREYMADREFMTSFTAEEREFYILLSLFADDAGWLYWDTGELAATLYRYEPLEQRETKVETFRKHLESTARLKVLRCGHAVMPRVAKRPRGMAREYGVQSAHQEHSMKSTRVLSPPNLTLPIPNLSSPRAPAPARGGRRGANGLAPVQDVVGDPEAPWNKRISAEKK